MTAKSRPCQVSVLVSATSEHREEFVAHRDMVVIGASAGGLEALKRILSAMPQNLEAAILIVLHTANHSGSLLAEILERAGNLPVSHPRDGDRIQRGKVYIAPPGFHMIVEEGLVRVLQGPRENLQRPAIDPLFRSAAAAYGRRVIGIILTGMLDDGTAGLMVVSASGGEAIIEDPQSASFSSMPRSALDHVPNAHVAPLSEVPAMLLHLIRQELPLESNPIQAPPGAAKETRIAELDMTEISVKRTWGNPLLSPAPIAEGCFGKLSRTDFFVFAVGWATLSPPSTSAPNNGMP
jgi:two-component system chemotaxis response regulator CheB